MVSVIHYQVSNIGSYVPYTGCLQPVFFRPSLKAIIDHGDLGFEQSSEIMTWFVHSYGEGSSVNGAAYQSTTRVIR